MGVTASNAVVIDCDVTAICPLRKFRVTRIQSMIITQRSNCSHISTVITACVVVLIPDFCDLPHGVHGTLPANDTVGQQIHYQVAMRSERRFQNSTK